MKKVITEDHLMHNLYDDLPWLAIWKAMNWSKFPIHKFSEFNTLATANPIDPAAKPEYQGGLPQREAYSKGKLNFWSIDSSNNKGQKKSNIR